MENELIKIEDLEVGDEVMISCQSCFKYLKILNKPKLSKTKLHWRTNIPMYSNVRCSTRQEVTTSSHTGYNGNPYIRSSKDWIVTPEGHNITISQDLSGRQIWLVKRATI